MRKGKCIFTECCHWYFRHLGNPGEVPERNVRGMGVAALARSSLLWGQAFRMAHVHGNHTSGMGVVEIPGNLASQNQATLDDVMG